MKSMNNPKNAELIKSKINKHPEPHLIFYILKNQ